MPSDYYHDCEQCGIERIPSTVRLCTACELVNRVEEERGKEIDSLRTRLSAVEGERDRYREALDTLTANIGTLLSNAREWRRLRACGGFDCDEFDRALRDFDASNASAFAALRVPGGQP